MVGMRVLDAPRALVFDMWSDPKHLAQWWGPDGFTTTTSAFDLRPGGVWRFVMHGPDGRDYQNRIVFEEVVRPERIVYRHGGAEDVDARVGHDQRDRRAADLGARVGMLGGRQRACSGDAPRVGPDQRQQAHLERALVQLDVAAELEAPDHVEQLLQRHALGVEQQLVARVEDPQVAEHLPLVGQERGVAPVARRQADDVIGHLAVQEVLGLRARQRELAALGAIDDERAGGHSRNVSALRGGRAGASPRA